MTHCVTIAKVWPHSLPLDHLMPPALAWSPQMEFDVGLETGKVVGVLRRRRPVVHLKVEGLCFGWDSEVHPRQIEMTLESDCA